MSTLGKILIKFSVSLILIYQIAYILNVYLTIKYKIEMMNAAEDILTTTYDITQILSIFIIFDILVILILLTYIKFIKKHKLDKL
ncbi:phospho-N-acetylmuramoyl-pentapeptide-transferase [Neisseria sp. HMSC066H01]|uniref:phospho-N-acetylmuramoyl-pentapeptide- transferase n=1 Tax=Neisseria sp. HMSC066H01 TaxID=1715031 RepID=UPI0008A89E5F|nr:phospho-N-acetylmuramoyl-pentapeptide-transferase [Neisseria sp. HMSC066H01]OHQ26697.1 phospho-N-acetylmuramoyl-pentapeptide-transferase [Neisseria sp. HMSC066H01]